MRRARRACSAIGRLLARRFDDDAIGIIAAAIIFADLRLRRQGDRSDFIGRQQKSAGFTHADFRPPAVSPILAGQQVDIIFPQERYY